MRLDLACARLALSTLALLAALSPPARAADLENGTILERRPYAFAAYDSVPALAKLFPREEYAEATGDRRFTMERVVYASSGLKVVAYTYSPARTPAAPLPVVVFNRGSWVREDIGAELVPMFRRLALAGFAVIAPLYRGSDRGEGRDEMGGGDLEDLMNVRLLAGRLSFADTSRLCLYGESRGGMMVFLALRDGFPARAAAVFGAFTDFDSLVAADPERYARICPAIWPDYAQRRAGIAERRSALRWAEGLRAPLLLMHGGADGEVDPAHALRLAERLQRLGCEYELHIYAGDGHVLKKSRVDRDARAAEWFLRHSAPRAE